MDGRDESLASRWHRREHACDHSESTPERTEDPSAGYALPAPGYGLRYGTTFPYTSVQGLNQSYQPSHDTQSRPHHGDRRFQSEGDQDLYSNQEDRRGRRGTTLLQDVAHAQDHQDHVCPARHALEQHVFLQVKREDDRDDEGCMLHSRSFPAGPCHLDRRIFDKARAEARRSFMTDPRAYQTAGAMPIRAHHASSREQASRAARSDGLRGILPGIRALPSLTERRSHLFPSHLSPLRTNPTAHILTHSLVRRRDMFLPTDPSRGGSLAPGNQYHLARDATPAPAPQRLTKSHNSSLSACALAALSTDSPTKWSRVSSKEGGYEVGSGGDTGDDTSSHAAPAAPPSKKKKKRPVRVCTTDGCDRLVVDHGVCIRHGGGKRCTVQGCDCRAQNKGLCWKHGGYTICQVDGCDKRAKTRRMCWSHGGGTQCKTDGCEKIAVSRGRCWAHGGGKRCKLPDCHKPAALRMDDYCNEHFTISCANRLAIDQYDS